MTPEEIFSTVNNNMITAVMLHDQLAEYFDFLDLHGYKRCHEYHALSELAERRTVVRYYVNHYNRLLPAESAVNPNVIPANWKGYKRQDVDASTKRKAIRDGITRWRAWEFTAKKLYEQAYCDLCEVGEIAAAGKIKSLIEKADMELKTVDRKHIELESIDYDLPTIYLSQDAIHAKYEDAEKKIGVCIC